MSDKGQGEAGSVPRGASGPDRADPSPSPRVEDSHASAAAEAMAIAAEYERGRTHVATWDADCPCVACRARRLAARVEQLGREYATFEAEIAKVREDLIAEANVMETTGYQYDTDQGPDVLRALAARLGGTTT